MQVQGGGHQALGGTANGAQLKGILTRGDGGGELAE